MDATRQAEAGMAAPTRMAARQLLPICLRHVGDERRMALRQTRPPLDVGLHWIWMNEDRTRMLAYEPKWRKKRTVAAMLHKVFYEGRIRRHDTNWQGEH